jgi:hypothetical protein
MLYNTTIHGLHEWFKHVFEKFGWMILAKREMIHNKDSHIRKDMKHKVQGYGIMMRNLLKALEERIKMVHEEDRRDDLQTMIKNTKTLMKFWNDVKGKKAEDGNRRSPRKRSQRRDGSCCCAENKE